MQQPRTPFLQRRPLHHLVPLWIRPANPPGWWPHQEPGKHAAARTHAHAHTHIDMHGTGEFVCVHVRIHGHGIGYIDICGGEERRGKVSGENDIIKIQVDECSSPRLSPRLLQMCYMQDTHIYPVTHTNTRHAQTHTLQADIIQLALLQSTLHHYFKQSLCIATPQGRWHHCILSAPSLLPSLPLNVSAPFHTHWSLC